MSEPTPQPAPTQADVPALLSELLGEVRALRATLAVGEAEGLDAAGVAALLTISVSKVHELNSTGLLPAPVQVGVGRCPRFLRSEILGWLHAGSPTRGQWEIIKRTQRRAG